MLPAAVKAAASGAALRSGVSAALSTVNLSAPVFAATASSYHSTGNAWSPELTPNLILPDPEEIANPAEIRRLMMEAREAAKDEAHVLSILKAAEEAAGLKNLQPCELKGEYIQAIPIADMAALVQVDWAKNDKLREALFATALAVKERIYGKRIVLFAPLYTANLCENACKYCGYSCKSNVPRTVLSTEEVVRDAEAIARSGHKRVLMLCGEHPDYTFEQFLEAVEAVGDVTTENNGAIRRINIEPPVLSLSDLKRCKATDKVGTYAIFQETYEPHTFKYMHGRTPKSDYANRVTAMDRAQLAGLDDNGMGVLFGLYDWRFDVLGLLQHADHLDRTYGVGPHTFSVPRIQPAQDAPVSHALPYPVDDDTFKVIVALLRLAVPYTGLILSTRETPELRAELLNLGVSQLSAGSRTDPGSYDDAAANGGESGQHSDAGQFELSDHRSLDMIVEDLLENDYIPSFCTACYRLGRTGEEFMDWAKKGEIHNCCLPNGLLTLAEYAEDFAQEDTKELAWETIGDNIERIPKPARRGATVDALNSIKGGTRDLYF